MSFRDANALPNGGRSGADNQTQKQIVSRTPIQAGSRDEVINVPGGIIVARRKTKVKQSSTCAFGSISTWLSGSDTVSGVVGGAVSCGASNFSVAGYVANLSVNSDVLLEIQLSGITPQTDDDVVIFLPGIASVSGSPSWNAIAYTGSENYTNSTFPTTPGSSGTMVIPIGRLTISGGVARFYPEGCGAITISSCAGDLSYTRTGAA